MKLTELLKNKSFDHTIIFGYYGGGNFGDELLLTTLINLLASYDYKSIEYAYMRKNIHTLLSHDYDARPLFGYIEILRGLLRSKNIIVGGGGHWGLDSNMTVLVMSVMVWVMRYIFRKKVYLLGIGYYQSTNMIGHVSAHIAASAANVILARDNESYDNFKSIKKRSLYLDKDIVFYLGIDELPKKNLMKDKLEINGKAIIIALRRFRGNKGAKYAHTIEMLIAKNQNLNFLVMLLEPEEIDPEGAKTLRQYQKKFKNVSTYAFSDNPFMFASFLRANASNLKIIAPQYHAQLVAHLLKIDIFPVSYDNKVSQLLRSFQLMPIKIEDVGIKELQAFVIK